MTLGARARQAVGLLIFALFGGVAIACGSTDEIVARVPCRTASDCAPGSFCNKATCDSPTGTCVLRPTTCCTTSDCGSDSYCSKAACDAPTGACVMRPASCMNDFGPVYGCMSGLWYWNDCLRQQHGEPASLGSAGGSGADGGTRPFSMPCSLTTPEKCPAGSFCAQFGCRAPTNSSALNGFCSVLPDQCPTTSISLPGGMPVPATFSVLTCEGGCTDYCSAVRNGTPIDHISVGQTCP